jgi:hypothetical protein
MSKISKFFIGLYVKATYARRALRDINKLKLGDIVYYQGKEWYTYQGVSDPYWKIYRTEDSFDLPALVHKKDLKMEPLWKRFKFSFLHTYRFYMANWYQIDMAWKGKFMYRGVGKENGIL